MPSSDSAIPLESFKTFGDLLKYLRRRARLTQRELSIAVGYSEAQISRLEQNQRPPDLSALTALFVPALYLEDEPLILTRLIELATQARGEKLPQSGVVTFSRLVQQEVRERVRTVEEEARNNLPLQLTSFIGREQEIDQIGDLLGFGPEGKTKNRLITLTGSGGCGKTRLALQVAMQLLHRYQDGVWLVELASISNPAHVSQTVITSLGIPKPREGSEAEGITKYLRTKHTLLILDNCEHVHAEVARLTYEILRSSPHVHVIATSREILNIPGEIRLRVPSLSVIEPVQSGDHISLQSEAVQLFVERAQSAFPNFGLNNENALKVMQICRRLDGLPLAIELAAARVNTLSIDQIAERLDKSFQILTSGGMGLAHHQTLDATIEWSYDLLSESERVLLHRLSVFSGGWTLEAAESVASDSTFIAETNVLDLLSQLVNKSLVVVDFQAHGETRYHLLESLRQYSLDKLIKSGEHTQVEEQHLKFFIGYVEKAEAGLMSAQSPYWLEQLDIEHDNLRAALEYGQSINHYEDFLRLAGGLFWFWQDKGYISEGRSQLEKILVNVSDVKFDVDPKKTATYAKSLWAAGSLAWIQGDYAAARSRLEESVQLWRGLEQTNRLGLAISLREMGILSIYQGKLDFASSLLDESIGLLDESGSKWDLALAFYNKGLVYESKNDVVATQSNFEKSLSLFRELNEPWGLAVALTGLGRIVGREGRYSAARSYLEESLNLSQALKDPWSAATSLYLLGEMARLQQSLQEAMARYTQSLSLNQTVGDRAMIGFTIHNVGKVAYLQDQYHRAAQLFGTAQILREDSTNTTSWSLTDQDQCEQDINDLRTVMGEEAFAAAWAEGQAMSADEAIGFALK